MTDSTEPLLDIAGLRTWFFTADGIVKAVDGVDITVGRGEVVGLVGESGSGKSVTMFSALRLVVEPGRIVAGSVRFDGIDILALPVKEMRQIRGNRITMVFQQPNSSLNPCYRAGYQIAEVYRVHDQMKRAERDERAVEMLRKVGIPDPGRRARAYPHQLSGGMAQRVMIAMALAAGPELLIADEPTTALDVTIQAQILDLMSQLRFELGMAMVLITHDLGVVAEMAERVAVMYAGQIVEEATTAELFAEPLHPYTRGLIGSVPVIGRRQDELSVIPGRVPNLIDLPVGCRFAPRCEARVEAGLTRCVEEMPALVEIRPGHKARCFLHSDVAEPTPVVIGKRGACSPLIEARSLVKSFPIRSGSLGRAHGAVHAVADVDLDVDTGEVVGLVGESGCGKTTLGRLLLRLLEPDSGSILFDGEDLLAASGQELRRLRAQMQIVFQDPFTSLDPRATIGDSIAEGLRVQGVPARERAGRVDEALELVGLEAYHARRYPHQFSGGQRQRIGIARALAVQPRLLVADEPVSALDVSIQSQILNLLRDLQRRLNLTVLFVAHDLAVVEHLCDRVAVMYLGRIVELGTRDDVFSRPLHPYTRALLSAIPVPDPTVAANRTRIVLTGDIPSPATLPSGCAFHTRCPFAPRPERCQDEVPTLRELEVGHRAACHWAEEIVADAAGRRAVGEV